jgi:hypothetical protein
MENGYLAPLNKYILFSDHPLTGEFRDKRALNRGSGAKPLKEKLPCKCIL